MSSDKAFSYKGYAGAIHKDASEPGYRGKVLGLKRDSITYEAESMSELLKEFQDSVDSYLEFCSEVNVPPEKPQAVR